MFTVNKRKISIIAEAKQFNLHFWETPSFLFIWLGIITAILILITFSVASRNVDVEIVVASTGLTAVLSLFVGGLIVKVLSKILIIDRAKSEFISLASHQLRTPLSGVKWALNIILEGEFGELNPELKKVLQKGLESNERMIILVDDLLNISRIESSDYTIQRRPIRIEKILSPVLNQYKNSLELKKIQLNVKSPKIALPEIFADKMKFTFVIQNLVDNAIKYSKEGSTIAITITSKGKYISFEIKDNGIGIPLTQQDQIFNKFFRSDNAIANNITGSGLGLYIIKSILDSHEALITYKSIENKGTTFTILVPKYGGAGE